MLQAKKESSSEEEDSDEDSDEEEEEVKAKPAAKVMHMAFGCFPILRELTLVLTTAT